MDLSDLRFDALYKQALKEWPQHFDFEILGMSEDGRSYLIRGFGPLADDIADKYIKTPQEIICRNLHYSISVIVHKAAASVESLDLNCLRANAVKTYFEQELKHQIEHEPSWDEDSKKLAHDYFEINLRKAQ